MAIRETTSVTCLIRLFRRLCRHALSDFDLIESRANACCISLVNLDEFVFISKIRSGSKVLGKLVSRDCKIAKNLTRVRKYHVSRYDTERPGPRRVKRDRIATEDSSSENDFICKDRTFDGNAAWIENRIHLSRYRSFNQDFKALPADHGVNIDKGKHRWSLNCLRFVSTCLFADKPV